MLRGRNVLWWAAAIAGYALLLDGAIETFAAGSPLRWIVAASVAIYVVASFAFWRRMTPELKAQFSVALLLALIALSGWQLGSLSSPGGFRVAGISADVLIGGLLLVILAALLVAAISSRVLPLWLRLACAALIVYAALPIIAALGRGGGLASALQSNAPFPNDPFWIRGAFIAVEILMPLATIGAVVWAGVYLSRGRQADALRLIAAAAAFVLIFQASGLEAANQGLPTSLSFERGSVATTTMGAVLPAATTIAPPSDASQASSGFVASPVDENVAAEAKRIGSDPAKLFGRVANGIGPNVYGGALRGPSGTLAAGAGNATDKALLLRALLGATGKNIETRFARCTLPADQAGQLVDAATAYSAGRQALIFELADKIASRVKDANVRAALQRAGQTWRATVKESRAQSKNLAAMVGGANIAGPSASDLRAQWQTLASRHIWLQVHEGDAWIDFDPTVPGQSPGGTRCKAGSLTADLPDQAYQRVTVSVVVEERIVGTLQKRTLLEKAWRIADLRDGALTFGFAEPLGLKKLVPSPNPVAKGMRAYTPVLIANDVVLSGQSFLLPILARATSVNPGSKTQDAVNQVIGAFGGSPAPSVAASPSAASTPKQEPTALFLDVAVDAADGGRDTFETPIFDRVGYAARRSGQIRADSDLPALPTSGGTYVPLLGMWSVAVWTGENGTSIAGRPAPAPSPGSIRVADSLASVNRWYYPLRQALFEASQNYQAARFSAGGPNLSVLALTSRLASNPQASGSTLRIDVLSNTSRAISASAATQVAPRATWAVSSLLAERLLLTTQLSGLTSPDVISIFDLSRGQGQPPVTLGPGQQANLGTSGTLSDAAARVTDQLAAGDVVMLPGGNLSGKQPADFGWWFVNRRDGAIRDEMANGYHQEVEEEAVVLESEVEEEKTFAQTLRDNCDKIRGVVQVMGLLMGLAGDTKDMQNLVTSDLKIEEAIQKAESIGKSQSADKGSCG
jgi:hypothetical protein